MTEKTLPLKQLLVNRENWVEAVCALTEAIAAAPVVAIESVRRLQNIKISAVLVTVLLAACGNSHSSERKDVQKIPDAVRNFDPAKFQPPKFNGVDLYTGPYRTPKKVSGLTIHGYNYTDTYIDSFTVDDAGGGNMEVSDGVNGGGGGSCCASIPKDFPLPLTVEIAWNRDSRMPWCKQTVLLNGPIPDDAGEFEVHFYQDGTIQVAITNDPSPARDKSPRFNRIQRKETGNVNNDSKFSVCGDRP